MQKRLLSVTVMAGLVFAAGTTLAADVAVDIDNPPLAIEVDGDLGEWQGVTPIAIDSTMVADAKDVSDNADLSATAYIADYSGTMYLAVDVTDDKVVMERTGGDIWQSDAVEFWIAGQQFGVTVDTGTQEATVHSWGGVDTSSWPVAIMTTDHGYNVELSLPLSAVASIINVDKIVADQAAFPFAIGMDDLDTSGGSREGQEYFPAGWAWGQQSTYATATFR